MGTFRIIVHTAERIVESTEGDLELPSFVLCPKVLHQQRASDPKNRRDELLRGRAHGWMFRKAVLRVTNLAICLLHIVRLEWRPAEEARVQDDSE